jgi:16S rRNA G966 N2-methylase RsmD
MRFAELYPDVGRHVSATPGPPRAVTDPLRTPSRGSKATAAYSAHSYPTKVPPEAIEPYLLHHTRPGDLVLDPFCGSGTTGLAARRTGRRAVLNDLGHGAVHLAANLAEPIDPNALARAGDRVLEAIAGPYQRWYRTTGRDGGPARIEWTLWSATVVCPTCGEDNILWAAAVDRTTGIVAQSWPCSTCQQPVSRRGATSKGEIPAWMSITDSVGRFEREPTGEDIERLLAIEEEPIEDWYPQVPLGPDREMYLRSALHLRGIETVDDFWTPRNLRAVARLWAVIAQEPDRRARQALAFAFTNTVWHATRMRRYNARGGQRPLTGTLYIPQLSIEVNPATVFLNKLKQLRRFYTTDARPATELTLLNGPAQALALPDSCIDYCFTDPPFGANIFYADVAVVWESWLGAVTDTAHEAVVNKSLKPVAGGKTVGRYADLMAGAFREIHRVLKPDAWTTIVFNSSDAEVWSALRVAVEDAGFDLASATHIDKTQQSFKGYKGRSGQEDVPAFDVVLNVHKPGATRRASKEPGGLQEAAELISTHLRSLPELGQDEGKDRERALPYLHSLLVQAHFNGSIGLEVGSYALVRRLCAQHFDVDETGHYRLKEPVSSPS